MPPPPTTTCGVSVLFTSPNLYYPGFHPTTCDAFDITFSPFISVSPNCLWYIYHPPAFIQLFTQLPVVSLSSLLHPTICGVFIIPPTTCGITITSVSPNYLCVRSRNGIQIVVLLYVAVHQGGVRQGPEARCHLLQVREVTGGSEGQRSEVTRLGSFKCY